MNRICNSARRKDYNVVSSKLIIDSAPADAMHALAVLTLTQCMLTTSTLASCTLVAHVHAVHLMRYQEYFMAAVG